MSNAWTDDPPKIDQSVGGLVFSRENGGLADHPVTEGVSRVATFTGQSLAGPPNSVPLLRFGETAVDRLPPDQTRTTSAAGRAQGIALEFGKGRVIVLGEAAMLTASDGADQPGGIDKTGVDNRRLALLGLRWLAGSDLNQSISMSSRISLVEESYVMFFNRIPDAGPPGKEVEIVP